VTLVKSTPDRGYTFCLATQDGSADAPTYFQARREIMTMRANESEREVEIKLNPASQLTGGEDFKIVLWDEEELQRLPGTNTTANVVFSTKGGVGHIGFKENKF